MKILIRVVFYLWIIICVNFGAWLALCIGSNLDDGYVGNNDLVGSLDFLVDHNWVYHISSYFYSFYTYYHGIPVCVWLVILFIILFFFIEIIRKWNDVEDFNIGKEDLLTPLGVFPALMILGFFIAFCQLGLGLIISIGFIIICFLFLLPYKLGFDWVIINHSFYFNYPTSWFQDEPMQIMLSCLNSVLFLVTLYFSFYRFPKNCKSSNNEIIMFFQEKHKLLSKVCLVYLVYLTPTIIAWLYPVIRINWINNPTFELLPNKIPNSFNYLALFFILGLVITIILIFRNNIKTMKINLKEELKEELMNEQEKTM